MDKKQSRQRRARRTRAQIRNRGIHRLCIHRTPRHIYAQVTAPDGSRVVTSASTVDAVIRKDVGYGGNLAAAVVVGRIIAERSLEAGVQAVAFDRSGFRYHGRIKALADAAREHGLKL